MHKNITKKELYSCKTFKANYRKGFTLAEILISLLILGVIASLTIPSLIQNTHKKEEVVKIKKGLSMINQAIATNYALTEKDLSAYNYSNMLDMFKSRMSVVSSMDGSNPVFQTQDGLIFLIMGDPVNSDFNPNQDISPDNYLTSLFIITKPLKIDPDDEGALYGNLQSDACMTDISSKGCIKPLGSYAFICGNDRCIPMENTAKLMNATDPTNVE